MEIQVKYNGLEDRQIRVKEQEAKGLRMLFDNFDNPDWKHGDPIIGTMTFTDAPEPTIIIPENPDKVILKKYLADPHSGLPDLESAFQALARLYLGV